MTPIRTKQDHTGWVMRYVHRGYHHGSANKTLPWCSPMHLTMNPRCPCQWVCDDCSAGRCARDRRACVEVWNAGFADWRLIPRPETALVHPSANPKRSASRNDVWLSGCCGRYSCKCECRNTTPKAYEQPTLFADLP